MTLERTLQRAYDLIEADTSGELPPRVAEELFHELSSVGEARLGVVALRTAARAAVYPQVHAEVLANTAAIRASSGLDLAAWNGAVQTALSGRSRAIVWFEQRQNEAAAALASALEVALHPTPQAWVGLLHAYRWAHLGDRQTPGPLRDGWAEWLDDVASVTDDGFARAVRWLARCLDGSLSGLPDDWTWEATYSDQNHRFGVSVCELPAGRLRTPVLELTGMARTERTITARVERGSAVVDPLRVEYLVRHALARVFLADSKLVGGEQIEFEVSDTGERWLYPLGQ